MINKAAKEQELLRQLNKGKGKAFREIYALYYYRLYYFSREYVNVEEDARDIVQNVFTKLWTNRSLLGDESNLGAWLFTVTRNECLSLLDHRRVVCKRKTEQSARIKDANYRALQVINIPGTSVFNIIDIFEDTLSGLTPQCKKVFELSRFSNMSNKKIAARLNISVKTVETHMSRALKALRVALSDYL